MPGTSGIAKDATVIATAPLMIGVRFAVVLSTKAPIGVCAMIPTAVNTINTNPIEA